MFTEIFRFELRQQLKSPLAWIFVLLFLLAGFGATSSEKLLISNAAGNVHINAPVVIASLSTAFADFGMLFVTVFIVGALLRDFEQRTAEVIFSTPVTRRAWLGGRFSAGFVIAAGVVAASMAGMALGTLMPWIDAHRVGTTIPGTWSWSFGVLMLPNLLFIAALLFALAAATRSLLASFAGVIVFFVLHTISGVLMSDIDNHFIAGMLDPFGAQAIATATRYWTADEYNTRLAPLTGVLLGNRALWLAVSVALFALGVKLFRPDYEGLRLPWRRRRTQDSTASHSGNRALPEVTLAHGARAHWHQFKAIVAIDSKSVLRGVLFVLMVLLGLAIMLAGLLLSAQVFGTETFPVTHRMVSVISNTSELFLLIVVAFYAGELVWRERSHRVDGVHDALPAPEWVSLAAKATTLMIMVVAFLLIGMLFTVGFQLLRGYTHLEPSLYFTSLALAAIPLMLTGLLALVLQVLANNKFVGYLLIVLYLVYDRALEALDFDHHLIDYADAPGAPYSDMNGFGHFLTGRLWFDGYWTLFALLLLGIAALFWARGADRGTRHRWREAGARLRRRPVQRWIGLSLLGFIASGTWIFYNTNVLNHYEASDAIKVRQADYEKLYGQYKDAAQPRVTAVKANVDIYPYERKLRARVHYTLVNKHAEPIRDLYVTWNEETPLTDVNLPTHEVIADDERLGFFIYRLQQPLAPGASMPFAFTLDFAAQGFKNELGGLDFTLLHNGAFFNNMGLFPSFGYNPKVQLTSPSDRRKYDLKKDVPRMAKLGDEQARANTYISRDSDWIDFEATVSTTEDQTALAPGYLQKTWVADGRRYFHYKMDAPMMNFYAFLSARWAVKSVPWNGVDISVYYNPAHAWNVDGMIDSAKDSLDYYNQHFTPYQFRQLRILEFPNYRTFAQAFANTVPFSESAGFIADLRDQGDIDYPYYITAHEVAHQWWAHRVIGADEQGSTLLSESLAQYSALMVMKHRFGEHKMRRFLKYELDGYLAGRITEDVGEQPLGKVENQQHIHYQKGSLVFYALQDYIGEATLNAVLKQFLIDKGFQQPPYPTSKELIDAIAAAVDPKWQPLLDDLFWKITLFDDHVTEASAKKLSNGKYEVTMKVHAAKYYADDQGKQTQAKMDIPLDIAVFARAPDGIEGNEKVLYLARRTVADGDSTITVTVDGLPNEVGIDPYNKLIDRNSGDNRKKVTIQ